MPSSVHKLVNGHYDAVLLGYGEKAIDPVEGEAFSSNPRRVSISSAQPSFPDTSMLELANRKTSA